MVTRGRPQSGSPRPKAAKPFAWDHASERGLGYGDLLRLLEDRLEAAKSDKEYAYLAALYTQLRNGCRVSEAARALLLFSKSGSRKLRVPVSKRRDRVERLVLIPPNVEFRRVAWLAEEFKRKPLEKAARALALRLKVFSLRELGINTHSLRYAFITHLAEKGVAPQLIAKITGHARLDYVLHYTQRMAAEDLLEKLVQGEQA
jgi:integrase